VLCDEPTGNLDENNSIAIQELIWELNEKLHQTFVIVTHEERIARKGHRVFKLEHGKLHPVRIQGED
jgi:ABC-type lipoprotein export system ATPase subunit